MKYNGYFMRGPTGGKGKGHGSIYVFAHPELLRIPVDGSLALGVREYKIPHIIQAHKAADYELWEYDERGRPRRIETHADLGDALDHLRKILELR